ncbi:hypothetical protein [Paenibacillus polymyxa]|nr:hypothetical protein [Paenibacillus polymyxa]
MLTDVFEMEGWDTDYLGANVPNGSVIEAIEWHQGDVVGHVSYRNIWQD